MKKWYFKAIVQKVISLLPYPEKVNFIFQKYITKGVNLTDDYLRDKLIHADDHINYFRKYSNTDYGSVILELGTGWYPIIPIMLYLSDTGSVISVDIQKWMNKKRQVATIQKIVEWRKNKKLQGIFKEINEKKWEKLRHIAEHQSDYTEDQINEIIGLKYMIQDAGRLELEANSVDFVCSNNTIEHIRFEELRAILREFKRVLKPNGVMGHFIDLSDHFAHFDQSISIYNFLKYSKKRWSIIDNSIQAQNRLRYPMYISLCNELEIPISETFVREGNVFELEQVKIHSDYSQYSSKELAISHCYIVSCFHSM